MNSSKVNEAKKHVCFCRLNKTKTKIASFFSIFIEFDLHGQLVFSEEKKMCSSTKVDSTFKYQ